MNWERYLGWLVLGWHFHLGEVDPDRVARWHAGQWLPTYADLADIEERAGLPPKAMTSLAGLLHVAVEVAGPRPEVADELCDAALADEATAAQWGDLGWLIRTRPEIAPTGDELKELIQNLLNALPRGVKHTYRLMRVATLDIASVPELRGKVVEGIRLCLEDVEGPAFLEPIGLLDQLSTPEAHALILDLMERPRSRPQRRYAAGLAAQVLLRGAFNEADRGRVVMNVLAGWRSDPVEAEADLGQIVDAFPGGLASVLPRSATRRAEPTAGGAMELDAAEDVEEPESSRVSRWLTSRSLAGLGDGSGYLGPQLDDLLRQALFFRNAERRLRAGQILSSSPFGSAVAAGLVDLMTTSTRSTTSATVRQRAAALFNNVIGERHLMGAIPLIDDDDITVASSVTTAFGHASYSEVADQVIRKSVPAERLPKGRACLYALGMTGSPGIAAMAGSYTVPRWQKHTARWWHEHGAAIYA
ncbi:MAG: hypothetical protein L0H93_07230 [Nocardioides sp.]|nr:hypothetical protein [Nocardioides sp.]